MWMRSRDWLLEPAGVSIPDSDTLQVHACAPAYTYDTHQRAPLESRERCAFAAVRSPDGSDVVALRFAEPVQDLAEQRPRRRHAPERRMDGGLCRRQLASHLRRWDYSLKALRLP
jgi:hypothetical protein